MSSTTTASSSPATTAQRDTSRCATSPTSASVVDQLLVAPGHERMGVGHRLLEYAEQYAIERRASGLRIAVESNNSAARSFYRRAGFVPVERELFELDLGRPTPRLT